MKSKKTTFEEYSKDRTKRTSVIQKYSLVVLFLIPFLTFFSIFVIYPFFKGIYMSFFHWNTADPTDTYFVGLKNYYEILFQKETIVTMGKVTLTTPNATFYNFWYSLLYTVLYCLVCVPLCIILPLLFSILIKAKPAGYKIFRNIIYLPSIFALSATGTAFVYLFASNDTGFVNNLFNIDVNWLGETKNAWFVILLLCLYGIGGNFIILNAALENVDKSLYEASNVDGCNGFQKLIYVTLPNIKFQLIFCTFNTIIGYLNLYGQNRILTGGGPADFVHPERPGTTTTVIYVIQNYLSGSGKFSLAGKISAFALCFGFIISLIVAAQLYLSKNKKGGHRYEKEFLAYLQQE